MKAVLRSPARLSFAQEVINEYGSEAAYLDTHFPIRTTLSWAAEVVLWPAAWLPAAAALGWPWLTFLTLMVFMSSIHRARMMSIHVLRCVVYSFDVLGWLGLALILLTLGELIERSTPTRVVIVSVVILNALVMASGLIAAARLATAYNFYLKFDHAVATLLASQVIVLLILVNLVVFVLFP